MRGCDPQHERVSHTLEGVGVKSVPREQAEGPPLGQRQVSDFSVNLRGERSSTCRLAFTFGSIPKPVESEAFGCFEVVWNPAPNSEGEGTL